MYRKTLMTNLQAYYLKDSSGERTLDQGEEIKRDKNASIIYRGEDNSYYEKMHVTGEVKCIDEEVPFEIPKGWEWCRLNDLALYRKGPLEVV